MPHAQTIIIALTANAFEEDRQRALEAECNDFVRKPFREEEIFEKMTEYLGVRYIYEEQNEVGRINDENTSLPTSENVLHPSSLQVMPAEWIAKLHTAAISAREKEIWKLIEQIPPEQATLAEGLAQKVKDFRLDQIIELTSNE